MTTTTLETANALADSLIERACRGDHGALADYFTNKRVFEHHMMQNTVRAFIENGLRSADHLSYTKDLS